MRILQVFLTACSMRTPPSDEFGQLKETASQEEVKEDRVYLAAERPLTAGKPQVEVINTFMNIFGCYQKRNPAHADDLQNGKSRECNRAE